MYCNRVRRRSVVDVKMPRAMQSRSMRANQRSTWLSQLL
jgi:hypothetical protein